MKTITSKVYLNQKIKFSNEIIEFQGGKAQVSEEICKKITKELPGVFEEGDLKVHELKSKKEDDDNTIFDKAFVDAMKTEYLTEIDRLSKINETKDKTIADLKVEVDVWKKECEKIKKAKSTEIKETEETKSEEVKDESQVNELKEDLLKMTLKELEDLAKEEGIKFKKTKDKNELIDQLISFYQNK